LAAGSIGSVALGGPVTLDFEGQGYGDNSAVGSYGGLTFGEKALTLIESVYHNTYHNNTEFPSGEIVMYNNDDFQSDTVRATSTSGGDFDAISAMVSWWGSGNQQAGYSSTSITIEGWDDGVLVGTSTTTLNQDFQLMVLGFSSIDELRFINDGSLSHKWLLDDLVLDFDPSTVVPLPTASALAGLGLLGAGLRRSRGGL